MDARARQTLARQTLARRIVARQNGIVTRPQALAAGVAPKVIRGRVERGEWQRLHPGVYATFSGPLSWEHRAWAAVLVCGDGAALGFHAAAHLWGFGVAAPRRLDVLVPADRKVANRPGLLVHRRNGLDRLVRGWPPRSIHEETVLDLVGRARNATDVVGILTAGLRAGASADEISLLLAGRGRQRWRGLLHDVLTEAVEGVESPLEWRYRHDVERRHGLPSSELQVVERLPFGIIRADARYRRFRTRVELDGRLVHKGRVDDDAWRDNEVRLRSGELTLRYRWVHVVGTPCQTAAQVSQALWRGDWTGSPKICRLPGCHIESIL